MKPLSFIYKRLIFNPIFIVFVRVFIQKMREVKKCKNVIHRKTMIEIMKCAKNA